MNLAFTGTQKNFNIFFLPVSLTEQVRITRQGGRDASKYILHRSQLLRLIVLEEANETAFGKR